MKRFQIVILFLGLFFGSLSAQDNKPTNYPSKDFNNEANPIASEDAEVGGRVVIFAHQYPKSFNYYTNQSWFSSTLFGLLYDTLLGSNPITLERIPGIVNKWAISADKTTYTMSIDPNAKWSDGKPISPADVVYTYEIVMKSLTGSFRTQFEKLNKPEIIDEHTFKIVAKEVHWSIEDIIANIQVLPKHVMESKEFEKINFEFPVVSGSYKIKEIKEEIFVELERRNDWWQGKYKANKGINNFQFIKYKFFAEENNAWDAFQKGEIDLFAVYMAKRWVEMAVGEKYDKYQIVKQKVYNFNPTNWQGFVMNMRRPLFQDKKVRQALAHLLNRNRFNEELMFNQYTMTNSYFEDLYSKEIPMKNRVVDFNKEKAKKLLEEAGWKPNKDGILEKDGRTFEFNFLTNDSNSNKFLDIYSDDLKNVGH
jgi:microcin C transport system substrate-binding protein